MESPAICSSERCHFKLELFTNDEQFLHTLTEFIDCRSSYRGCITDPTYSSPLALWFDWVDTVLYNFDRLFLRAEKIPMLRGYIPKAIEVEIHPQLRRSLRRVNETIGLKGPKGPLRCLAFHSWPSLELTSFSFLFESYLFSTMIKELFRDIVSAALIQADLDLTYNAIASVVVLSIMYQYLFGYVDRGGTKTYNPGSLEFRATYVSLLLFRGAYVWIKFRDVAPRTAYRRSRTNESGQVQYYGKYEPRFKPLREKDILKHNYLPLGGFDTRKHAEVVCQIAGFYYGKDEGVVAMEDGSHFSIPEMSEQERSLCGEGKRKWVSEKAKAVFREFKEKAVLSANAGEQVDARPFSPPADEAVVAFSTASDDEFAEFLLLSGLAHEHHDPLMRFDPEDFLKLDADVAVFQEALAPIMQERLNEQLNLQKEQLEADFNRRLVEEHQKRRRLEEEIMEVRQENKRLKTMLQQAATPLRAFFVTSTVELEG